ncbi:MAG: hypothetical protein MUO50_13420, partial [Longimicrobiales bacterium]|nr:hypothetical protein [Longimicrobiales bacterium]
QRGVSKIREMDQRGTGTGLLGGRVGTSIRSSLRRLRKRQNLAFRPWVVNAGFSKTEWGWVRR